MVTIFNSSKENRIFLIILLIAIISINTYFFINIYSADYSPKLNLTEEDYENFDPEYIKKLESMESVLENASKKSEELTKGLAIGIYVLTTVPMTVFIIILYLATVGLKVEITKSGINLGRRYYGPLISLKKMNVYKWPKLHRNELLIEWNEIKIIKFGRWDRDWARASIRLSNLISRTKIRSETPYYIIVETKNSEFFISGIKKEYVDYSRNIMEEFGHKNLIKTGIYDC